VKSKGVLKGDGINRKAAQTSKLATWRGGPGIMAGWQRRSVAANMKDKWT